MTSKMTPRVKNHALYIADETWMALGSVTQIRYNVQTGALAIVGYIGLNTKETVVTVPDGLALFCKLAKALGGAK